MNPLDISAGEYRKLAHRAADLTADFLEKLPELPSFPATSGKLSSQAFDGALPEQGVGEAAFNDLQSVLDHSRPPSPRFFAYVLGSGEPVAAVGDLVASVLNQNVTAWRSAPSAVAIERTVVGWLAELIGCKGYRGSLTGGGSSANLMGLAMAREAKAPANDNGVQPGIVYASTEIHMSIPKALALLGLGHHSLRLIPIDAKFRMRTDLLRKAIAEDRATGKRLIAVVASAGTVNTGSIDPLAEIADIAQENGLWMHVDGAYGALAAAAAPEKFHGLNRADSLSLDAHKWLYQPLDCGCLLYKDVADATRAFAHSGDYVKALVDDPVESFAFFEESVELSRRFRALKIWLSLRYHGAKAFRDSIANDLHLAQHLKAMVEKEPRLELLAPVTLSAVCFRYVREGASEAESNALNTEIMKRSQRRGKVFISNATIDGKFALRACIVNHRATQKDVEAVANEVLEIARELWS